MLKSAKVQKILSRRKILMDKNFPNAQETYMQLLYDRHDFLYVSDSQLSEKTQALMCELIASRPRSNTTAFEHLEYQYKSLRLQTLLGIVDTHGVFKARVPYDVSLGDELKSKGYSCVHAPEDADIMEVLSFSI